VNASSNLRPLDLGLIRLTFLGIIESNHSTAARVMLHRIDHRSWLRRLFRPMRDEGTAFTYRRFQGRWLLYETGSGTYLQIEPIVEGWLDQCLRESPR
jgi:hypothetical protein